MSLQTDTWYDARGQVIKSAGPGGLVQKMAYDGVGWVTVTYLTDGGGDSGYGDADDVTGDAVLEQTEQTYDDSGNLLTSVTRQRFHDESDTGALGTPSSGVNARVSYMGYYYDLADRTTDVVDVGTNGGSAWTRPGTVPSRSDSVLVTSTTYDDAGRVYEVTDPKGIVSRTLYDALGRTTKRIENHVDGPATRTTRRRSMYKPEGPLPEIAQALCGGLLTAPLRRPEVSSSGWRRRETLGRGRCQGQETSGDPATTRETWHNGDPPCWAAVSPAAYSSNGS